MNETSIYDIHGLIKRLNRHLNKITYKDLITLLSYAQVLRLWIEQVWHLLQINLKEWDVNRPVLNQLFFLQLLEWAEYELKRLWHNAFASLINLAEHTHRVSLTRASLAIDEVCAIVPIEHVHNQR